MHLWMLFAAVGIGGASIVPQLPSVHLAVLLLCAAAGSFFWPAYRPLIFVAAGLGAGFAYATLYGHWLASRLLPQELEQQQIIVEGFVTGLPEQAISRGRPVQRFTLVVEHSEQARLPVKRIELSWYDAVEIRSGASWRLLVKLKRPRGFANPGGYDYQLALHQRRIDARGYVKSGELLAARQHRIAGLRSHLYRQLQLLETRMSNARFVSALSIGAKKALTNNDWDLLRRTGTTHLFVVSGLHIGLVAGLCYTTVLYLCKLLVFPLALWPAQRFAAVAACCGALAYAGLAGFSLPTQRACVMLLVAMLGFACNRPARAGGVLITALFAVLVLDPLAPRSASFWLSYGAVTALVLGFSGRLVRPGVIAAWLRTQWLVFVVLTPLLLLWFQQASLLMPMANLLAVPLVSIVIVPTVLLLAMLLLLGIPPPELLLACLDTLFSGLWAFLQGLQSGVGEVAQLQLATGYPELLAALLGAGLLLLPRGFPLRVLAPLFFLPAVAGRIMAPHAGVELTVLDVGQGLAVVLQVDDKTMVYDTGPKFSANFDAGSAIIASFLRYKAIHHIDQLVVSHADSDHAGGMNGLLRSIPAHRVMLGEPLQNAVPGSRPCRAGDSWRWGVVEIEVLHPLRQNSYSSNNSSCVLHIKTPRSSVLIAGDIEAAVERQLLLNYAQDLRADILIVPHHGSKTSSTAAFIDAVQPRYAVVSSGYLNRFGHPHPGVIKRYEQNGSQLLTTAHSGSISFTLPVGDDQGLAAPSKYRQQANRYWYAW